MKFQRPAGAQPAVVASQPAAPMPSPRPEIEPPKAVN
jgi:hypothetical protein